MFERVLISATIVMSGLGGDTDAAGAGNSIRVCGDGGRVLWVQLRLCHRANHPNSVKVAEREYSERIPRNAPVIPQINWMTGDGCCAVFLNRKAPIRLMAAKRINAKIVPPTAAR